MNIKLNVRAAITAAFLSTAFAVPALLPLQAHAQATEQQQSEALEFFEGMSTRAFALLKDTSLAKEEQLQAFRDLFMEVTAVDKIGPLLLGHYARQMSEEQMETYTGILPGYVVGIYTDRILQVGDEQLTVLNTYAQGRRDVWVASEITSPVGGDPLRADWRIRQLESGEFTLLDLKVENISLFMTKKDEFMAFIDRNGIDAFLKRLAKDAKKSAA